MWALSAGLLDQPMCLPEDFSLNATDHEDDHHRRLGGGAGETWAATLRTLMLFLMMSPGNFWGGGLSPSYYTAKCSLEAILKAGLGALQLSEVFCWFIDNKQRMFPGLTWMVTCDLCEFARAGESPQRHHLSVNSFPKDVEKHLLYHSWINGTGSRDLSISSMKVFFSDICLQKPMAFFGCWDLRTDISLAWMFAILIFGPGHAAINFLCLGVSPFLLLRNADGIIYRD